MSGGECFSTNMFSQSLGGERGTPRVLSGRPRYITSSLLVRFPFFSPPLLWVPAVRRSAYTRFSIRSMESGLRLLLIVSSDDPSSLPKTPKWKKLREERS